MFKFFIISLVGPPTFVTSDFQAGSATQTVGFPSFIYVETFVATPVARVEAVVNSPDYPEVTYSLADASDALYVDAEFGLVYARDGAGGLSGLCGEEGCKVVIEAASVDDSQAITLTVLPASEEQV